MRPRTTPMRAALGLSVLVMLSSCAKSASEYRWEPETGAPSHATGEIWVKILEPSRNARHADAHPSIEVRGAASALGMGKALDLIFVVDSSNSLLRSDPEDYRSTSAFAVAQSFLPMRDVRIGMVDFDAGGELVQPLTSRRSEVLRAIRRLDRRGRTDLAAGIRAALAEFERAGRVGTSRVILLVSDGKSNARQAYAAMLEARRQGVAVSTVLLGGDEEGETILRGLATGTGGGFLRVSDPANVGSSLAGLGAFGVKEVLLRVNDSPPLPARLVGGTFAGQVPLRRGLNRIEAIALGRHGRRGTDSVTVTVGPPGCAELKLRAVSDGRPAVSLSERAVEIVFDASRSMWGRVGGRPKIEVAKRVLAEAFGSAPDDLRLGLRVYGHRTEPSRGGCRDSELLVPITAENRARVLEAISALRPRGKTPLAHVLEQIARDFDARPGARAVVLVTDGVETCGGDPLKAARALGKRATPVHVIGFGLKSEADEDAETLRAIARVSGGRFLVASSGAELRSMLGRTVGTRFRVFKGDAVIAEGAIGSEEGIRLPAGAYRVRFGSSPAREISIGLPPEAGVTLVLQRRGRDLVHSMERHAADYAPCTGENLARLNEF